MTEEVVYSFKTVLDDVTKLLALKPRTGFIESVVTTGGVQPLDALEKLSVSLAQKEKDKSLLILKNALTDEEKQLLNYIDNAEDLLTELKQKITQIPDQTEDETIEINKVAVALFILFTCMTIGLLVFAVF